MKRYIWLKKLTVSLLTVIMLVCPLYCGVTASAAGVKIDSDVFEDIMNPTPFTVGEYVDPNKTYEYVESTLFNEAGQEVWDLTEAANGVTITAGQEVSEHKAVKISTSVSGTSNYPSVYFWNRAIKANGADTDRVKIDALFASTDVTQYKGIRVWMNKPATNQYTKIQISLGYLGRGDVWAGHSSKEYMYSLALPTGAFEGYVYIPFTELKNAAGNPILPAMSYKEGTLDQIRAINFIGFKYSDKKDSDIYFGELALYREGARGIENSGKLNIGQGVELDSSKEYVYLSAIDFNKAGDDTWNQSKMSGFEVKTGITNANLRPSDAKSSVKLHTTGSTNTPFIFYWKEYTDKDNKPNRSTHGSLFGSTTDLNDYEGIRLWVKAADEAYTTITLMIGKMYNNYGYYPTVPKTSMVNGGKENHYAYTLVVNGGFEGYVNIPFANFVDLLGRSVTVDDFNYIAFKVNDNYKKETDFYISNLQAYGLKKTVEEGGKDGNTIGVLLDSSKKYEIVPSLVFNDSTQELWNQSKIMGMEVTVGITDPAFVPKAGKTSIKLHTTGEKSAPDIYYWNEKSDGGRRTHSKFWGSTDCTEYEGIRLWIKVPEDNTYSKLQIYTGQMFTGYWPSEKNGGFFAYQIELPRGGYEGYINIPFSSFVNTLGKAVDAKNINFIAFKYNESGFKVSDLYISDLSLYRVSLPTVDAAPDAEIMDGGSFEIIPVTKPDGTVIDDMGNEYVEPEKNKTDKGNKDSDTDTDANSQKGFNVLWIIIPIGILLIAAIIFLIIFIKKKKA